MRLENSTSHLSHWPIHSLSASTPSANLSSRRMASRALWSRVSAVGDKVGSNEAQTQHPYRIGLLVFGDARPSLHPLPQIFSLRAKYWSMADSASANHCASSARNLVQES